MLWYFELLFMKKKYFYISLLLIICVVLYFRGIGYNSTENRIKVSFTIDHTHGLDLEFTVLNKQMTVQRSKLTENKYRFKNTSTDTLFFRPIHQLFPNELAEHYKMLKCFCFDDMMLLPNENLVLPMTFLISKNFNNEINEVRVHYAIIKRSKEDVLIVE